MLTGLAQSSLCCKERTEGDICCTQQPHVQWLHTTKVNQKNHTGTWRTKPRTPQPLMCDCGGSVQAQGCGQMQTKHTNTHKMCHASASMKSRMQLSQKTHHNRSHPCPLTTGLPHETGIPPCTTTVALLLLVPLLCRHRSRCRCRCSSSSPAPAPASSTADNTNTPSGGLPAIISQTWLLSRAQLLLLSRLPL